MPSHLLAAKGLFDFEWLQLPDYRLKSLPRIPVLAGSTFPGGGKSRLSAADDDSLTGVTFVYSAFRRRAAHGFQLDHFVFAGRFGRFRSAHGRRRMAGHERGQDSGVCLARALSGDAAQGGESME